MSETKPMVRLSKLWPEQWIFGLRMLLLEMLEGGKTVHRLNSYSGQPGCQEFRRYSDPGSWPGNLEPIPQGWHDLDTTKYAIIERGTEIYNNGIGKWCTPLYPRSRPIKRDEFLVHMDYNKGNSPGTAGCAAILHPDHEKIWIDWRKKWDRIPLISFEVQWGL